MRTRISASELGEDLPAILERVRRRGASFLIEQDGEAVAALEPLASVATWATLVRALHEAPMPDPSFADDLEEAQRSQPSVPNDAWAS